MAEAAEMAWHLVPIAFALALSAVPIAVTITILLTSRRAAVPFAAGWVAGLVVVLGAFVLFGAVLPTRPQGDGISAAARVAIGVALLLLGAGTLLWALHSRRGSRRGGGRGDRPPHAPKTHRGRMNALSAFGLGFVLDLRLKSLLLCAAAGLDLHRSGAHPLTAVTLGILFVGVAASSVVGLTVYSLVARARADRVLEAIRAWLTRNGSLLSAGVLLAVGLVVLLWGLRVF